jgi:hypothetical protein
MVLKPWMLGKLLIILDGFLFIFGYLKKYFQPFNSSTN